MSGPSILLTVAARARDEIVEQYRSFVAREGARVTVVRPGDAVPARIDGLLLSGGADVDPREYSHEPGSLTRPEPERDAFERPLLARAIQASTPVLAICRGFQLVNVVYGGTLIQHLEGHSRDEMGESRLHLVHVRPGTRLREILDAGMVQVNSSHHQGVADDQIARGLHVSARTNEGLIEGIEAPDRWVVGVQWHPERSDEVDSSHRRLAASFVRASAVADGASRLPAV
ncbi:MAG: gamma-glutamyl-gamma-aminobutyrate hydrolase family protein [Chloroflexi bacterium]|nr:gamma-glutamyl-gamma-aminobutyrate hydrolase family protein [Chloroflexota bacterium]